MIDERTGKDLKEYPALEEPMVRIYIFLNDAGRIKIGQTKNILQRYNSLCGSNGGSFKIVKSYVSPGTYLYTLERIMHQKFSQYRIPGTEWFHMDDDPTSEKLFSQAINELQLLFSSTTYKLCNETRRKNGERTNGLKNNYNS